MPRGNDGDCEVPRVVGVRYAISLPLGGLRHRVTAPLLLVDFVLRITNGCVLFAPLDFYLLLA